MAAHSVGIAAREYLRGERCVALWLAPTTAIVDQTLKTLRNKKHPCRQALDEAFDGAVSVMDIDEAKNIARATVISDAVVIVSTMAALRVENTDGRKIYDDNGALMPHFTGLTEEQKAPLASDNGGEPAKSLANLLRLHRPLVIVDEAHNARTGLSFDTLARFAPSCILEFTATPDQKGADRSNVLSHVSAAELKAEEMIKLPIILKTREQWGEAVQEALARQNQLERLAIDEEKAGAKFIRPVVLFQAQSRAQGVERLTPDLLKKALIEDFKLPEDQIAIVTGSEDELGDRDVMARECPVRFIITVNKLREGWDCPFAYVLCSVANLSGATAVEQILGRILRLPYARRSANEALNLAYAFVTSSGFQETAATLSDALVESGFEKFEAQAFVKPVEQIPLFPAGTLFGAPVPVTEEIKAAPDLAKLSEELRARFTVEEVGAVKRVTYSGPPPSAEEARKVISAFKKDDRAAAERLCERARGESKSPAEQGVVLAVPHLSIRIDGRLELFEDQHRELAGSWAKADEELAEADFKVATAGQQIAIVDVDEAGKIARRFVADLQRQLSLLEIRGPQTETELVLWLDRHIPHPDLTQSEAHQYLAAALRALISKRGYALEQVVAHRFRLRDALEKKMATLRQSASNQAYQQLLIPDDDTSLEVSPEIVFTYSPREYPASSYYEGPIQFAKHYFPMPAAMNDEEAACAAVIDGMPEVELWVRNIERQPGYSFWLPTATDRFYPDFVAFLKDGRVLVIEYKGAHLMTTDDTKEKNLIGELWEKRSGGRCVFRLVTREGMGEALRIK
jgi:type III restriction enzyme